MDAYTIETIVQPSGSRKVVIKFAKRFVNVIKVKVEQLQGVTYLFTNNDMSDTTLEACISDRATFAEADSIYKAIESICDEYAK